MLLTSRAGRTELNYTSITYSTVAGILRFQRQEEHMGDHREGWFVRTALVYEKPSIAIHEQPEIVGGTRA